MYGATGRQENIGKAHVSLKKKGYRKQGCKGKKRFSDNIMWKRKCTLSPQKTPAVINTNKTRGIEREPTKQRSGTTKEQTTCDTQKETGGGKTQKGEVKPWNPNTKSPWKPNRTERGYGPTAQTQKKKKDGGRKI